MAETEPNRDQNTASQRHWLYGFNAAVLVTIAIAIIGFFMVICEMTAQGTPSVDLSSNGVNSLSGSTRLLLKEIDSARQEFQIVSLFVDPSAAEKANGDKGKVAEKRRQVMDLLKLYARGSSHIRIDDQGDTPGDEIQRKIRERYDAELKPYEKAATDFDGIAKKFKDFVNSQASAIAAAVAQENASAEEREFAARLQAGFRDMPASIESMQRRIRQEQNETLPGWTDLIDRMKEDLEVPATMLSLFADLEQLKAQELPPAMVAYFTRYNKEYKEIADAIKQYRERLSKLEPLKVQEVLSNLRRNSVVVLGPDAARVITSSEIFEPRNDNRDPSAQETYSFRGEQSISSALLAMSHREKVKVVLVSPTSQNMLARDFSAMAKILKDENFEVLEWSPPSQNPQGGPPQGDPVPPAEGKGVVWLVYPAEPPSMMMMSFPDTESVATAVRKHMAAGGQAMFFAIAGGGGMFGPGEGYAYDSVVKSFGIDVQTKYTVMRTMQVQDRAGNTINPATEYFGINHYESHPITRPIESLQMGFWPTQENTVVDLLKEQPSGVEAQILIRTPNSPDYFATVKPSQLPTFDKANDRAAPVPIAALSVKNKGKPDEQRILVVGNRKIADSQLLEAAQPREQVGNLVFMERLFPGNEEFMRNSILWLAGHENMIEVSARADAASRIVATPNALLFVRILTFVLPFVALLIGGLVLAVRHR